MIGVIVELQPLVSASFASSRLDHRPCLRRLRRAVVAAELVCQRVESELALSFPSAADNVLWTNLTVYVVVIVLTVGCMGCQRYDNFP